MLSKKTVRVFLSVSLLLSQSPCLAGSIDTNFSEKTWPKQRTHDYEVGKYKVHWRQSIYSSEGILAGAQFIAPSSLQETWDISTDYSDIGNMTPGIEEVKWLERSENRQVIQMTIKVLWKKLILKFEIEQEPLKAIRFRLVNEAIGEYRGICIMREEVDGTSVDISTMLKTPVRVPAGLLLWAQKSAMLSGIRNFLKNCEQSKDTVGST